MKKVSNNTYKVVHILHKEIIPGIITEIEVRYKRSRGYSIKVTSDVLEKKRIILTSNKLLKIEEAWEILDKHNAFINKCFKDSKKVRISSINNNQYMLFGKIYEVIIQKTNKVTINDSTIIATSINMIDELGYELLTKRFYEIQNAYNYPKTNLFLRKMKTRWGVCSPSGQKITLAKALIHVPLECVDQVIFHEFTHFKIQNHSPLFHKELQKVCPNERSLHKKLNEYSEFLYE